MESGESFGQRGVVEIACDEDEGYGMFSEEVCCDGVNSQKEGCKQ